MKILDSIRFRIATLLHRSQMSAEMDEEMRAHLQHRADDLERSGLSRAEAERKARIEFGAYERIKEESHEAAGGTFIESIFKDVAFAFRIVRKSRGFTITAIVTLALAIGANAVVFGALNAVFLHPLNLPQLETLYSLHRTDTSGELSYPDYLDMRDRNRSFEDLAAFNITQATLDTGQNPSRPYLYAVTGNYFDVLGVQPYLGRLVHSSDEHGSGSAPYIVLSYEFWHTHFQDDRGVVGRVVQVDKRPFTIIGVAPPGFHGSLMFFSPAFYLPIVSWEQVGTSFLNVREKRWLFMTLGHLKPGVTPEQAAADINSIERYLEKTYPKDHGYWTLSRPSLYGDFLGRPVRAFLAALMLLAALILLAACANLGSLFAARAADRSREVALRLALGAGRLRILRQLLTEAVLISLAGGAIGLWGSVVLLSWLSAWQPFRQFPINLPIRPDANVYIVALLLALASGFLFGAAPVRQVLHTDPYELIKSGARVMAGRGITGRDLLVAVQIAICAVLVTSSMVAVRGLVRSLHTHFGFEPQNAILVDTDLRSAGYSDDAIPAMQKRTVEAIETIPGVTSAGLVTWTPLSATSEEFVVFTDETADLRPANAAAKAEMLKISPGYFRAAGTALLAGRPFTLHDDKNAPRVAVVNNEFARRIFGSVPGALGRYYKMDTGERIQVIGVAEDGKYENLTEDQKPAMFLPLLQSQPTETWTVVRSSSDPQQLAPAIRNKMRDLDAGVPCFIQTWTEAMDFPLFPSRVAAVALGILGSIGAMLSVTGIFGLASYSLSKRRRELGIRIALGAQRRDVLRAALGRALRLLAAGSAAGLALGILASRILALVVYQATPRDPLVLAGVVLAMLLLGLLATWIPAQQALSIDPLVLLREE